MLDCALDPTSLVLALPTVDPGDVLVQSLTQRHRGLKDTQACHGRIQVELVTGHPALEALEGVGLQIGGEAAASPRGGPMNRTRPAYLVAPSGDGHEVKQLQDVGQ